MSAHSMVVGVGLLLKRSGVTPRDSIVGQDNINTMLKFPFKTIIQINLLIKELPNTVLEVHIKHPQPGYVC